MSSSVSVSVCVLLVLASVCGVFGQTTYSLRCHGPLGEVFVYTQPTAGSFVIATFSPGTAGASTTPVPAGVCTWMDRGFRPTEPAEVIAYVKGSADISTTITTGDIVGPQSLRFATGNSNPSDPTSATSADVLNHLLTLSTSNVIYNFNAYNNNAGEMVLVSVDYVNTP